MGTGECSQLSVKAAKEQYERLAFANPCEYLPDWDKLSLNDQQAIEMYVRDYRSLGLPVCWNTAEGIRLLAGIAWKRGTWSEWFNGNLLLLLGYCPACCSYNPSCEVCQAFKSDEELPRKRKLALWRIRWQYLRKL